MKVLWQQILGILLVLLIALGISAYRVSSYMQNQIFLSRQTQLINYGQNIISNNFTRDDLERASLLLASENIEIQVYLSDGRIIYPTYDQRYNSNLSQENLESIRNGSILGLSSTQRYVETGEVVEMATVFLPITYTGGEFPAGFVSLGAPLEQLNEQVQSMQENIMVAMGIASVFGILLGVISALFQTRKIKRLQNATRQISQGNYDIEIDTRGRDELGDLARDFQEMAVSLDESQKEIKRQENLRRQFMMDAAHEMRTPLTTMSGLLEGLMNDMIPENQRERSLELINKETQRLTRLVNENLDYEKIRSNEIVLKPQKIEVKKLLIQIQQQLQSKANEKNNTIQIEAADNLVIWADNDRIVQILINLVTNAIQFTDNGTIIMRGKQLDQAVQIEVIDNGIGIDQDQLKSIWERFYKVDISRKNTKFGESGIGLAVVQSLVEAHNGTITVESELGKGSVFKIELPLPPEEPNK
ncbi:sensor histidine kinase [Fundicoccus culcitae]|uniref:histidine kinase n=1 Tax=Fundicoccus culcitae TaxID=2969821 RepID=A0ABY5P391_9LACT|nr:HAMP domain-containing sensor histidine kinase [Fundicoccus culcitae]UUX32913.1 HAMP domain-containing histidine kinase [Fundicoccus culcitae]